MINVTRDKNGREIKLGDILKVYHFTADQRRKKHYMYKQVVNDNYYGRLKLNHLTLRHDDYYTMKKDLGVCKDYEIVQSCGDCDFEDRYRIK